MGGISRARLASVPPLVWVLVLSFLCLVLFLGKPFFIDDTLFLRTAQQIQKHPGDFYGFQINWFHSPQPISEVTENPPLASYYLALAASLIGWSEPALHLAFLLPALVAVWGVYSLARTYCGKPAWAAAVAVFTPAFFVSATSVMCDVMLLAFWVWAVAAFEKGLARNGPKPFVAAGLLAGLAYLTKFSGLALVPLLAAYGLVRQRRLGWWLLTLLLPLLFAGGYEWLTFKLYGHGHLLQASAYSIREGAQLKLGGKLLIGLIFAGGCFLPISFYSPFLWRWQVLAGSAALFAAGALLLPHAPPLVQALHSSGAVQWGTSLQSALFLVGGILLVVIAAGECRQPRRPESLLLALWVAGVFTFAIVVNWVINARSFLPATPALAILLVRRFESRWHTPGDWPRWPALLLVVPAIVLCLLLARADSNVAQSARAAAIDACAKYQRPGRAIWFEGHWGFQYYMEELGAKALDMVNPRVGPDDMIVIPNSASWVSRPDPKVATPVEALSYRPNALCSTMNPAAGACFYAASWGPLPFVFGQLKAEHYIVFRPVPR